MNQPQQQSEALRLAAWLCEGAWHKMKLGDVEAAGRELRRLDAIVNTTTTATQGDDLPKRLLEASRHTMLTWDDRIAIGQAIARLQAADDALRRNA